MKTTSFLATLVALTMMFPGCFPFTGECVGGGLGIQCTADGAVYDDADSSADANPNPGGDTNTDSKDTADTKIVPKNKCDIATVMVDGVAVPFKSIVDGKKVWKCALNHSNEWDDCLLETGINNKGECVGYCELGPPINFLASSVVMDGKTKMDFETLLKTPGTCHFF